MDREIIQSEYEELCTSESDYDIFIRIAKKVPHGKCYSIVYRRVVNEMQKIIFRIDDLKDNVATINNSISLWEKLKSWIKKEDTIGGKLAKRIDLKIRKLSSTLEKLESIRNKLIKINKGKFTQEQYQKEQNTYHAWRISISIIEGMIAKNCNIDKSVVEEHNLLANKPPYFNGVNPIGRMINLFEGKIEGKVVYGNVLSEKEMRSCMAQIKKTVQDIKNNRAKISAGFKEEQKKQLESMTEKMSKKIEKMLDDQKDLAEILPPNCGHILIGEDDI